MSKVKSVSIVSIYRDEKLIEEIISLVKSKGYESKVDIIEKDDNDCPRTIIMIKE